ncbi:MAG: chemotaxis response regulator protein-glutamate methylesterase [Pseudomonadota bacterium]
MADKIKVFIIDDSALVRRAITDALHKDPAFEVVGVAHDPLIAMEKLPKLNPDVITLDMEMPRMDGLTYLKQLKAQGSTIPVVIISSLTQHGSQLAVHAMEAGAADVLAKPNGSMDIGNLASKLAYHLKAAALSRSRANRRPPQAATPGPLAASPPKAAPANQRSADRRVIVIGASTGGVEALRSVLPRLSPGLPPILVVQHIPAVFSAAVAQRINDLAPYTVREALDGERLTHGLCLIAPGDYHLSILHRPEGYVTRLTQTPPINFCRPAVDVLFRSAATAAGNKCLAVLLTGMGSDGAVGMQAVKRAGGITLAEHEDSCIVYGMPRAAVALGAVDQSIHLDQMPAAILRSLARLPL